MASRPRTEPENDSADSPREWALLTAAARITGYVERHAVDREMLNAAAALWNLEDAALFQIHDGPPARCRRLMARSAGGVVIHEPFSPDQEQTLASIPGAEAVVAGAASRLHAEADGLSLLLPIRNGHGQPVRLLRLRAAGRRLDRDQGAIQALLALYQNHLNLIDDSERDALTGLRNRRTFDHLLLSLLAGERLNGAAGSGFRRGGREDGAGSNWIAVLDIDRFKSINDRFGHLFGDEVLILIANLMQTCFRASDPLFRFGGEEFVIVLCGVNQAGAASAVDRFRERLESQVFPQVGRITVSAGYTEIAAGQPSSAILNRADAALYFAKANGRNRACCYEELLQTGCIEPETLSAASGADERRIELF